MAEAKKSKFALIVEGFINWCKKIAPWIKWGVKEALEVKADLLHKKAELIQEKADSKKSKLK